MRLAPNDQPGDQKHQRQKNGRGNAQTASKRASLDLGKATNRRDMSRVCAPETVECQDPGNDAAVNQKIGNACHPWNNIEEEVLLFGQKGIPRLGRGIGDDCVSCEKEGLCRHQPGQSLHDQIIFVLDLIPNSPIPVGRTKQIRWGHTHGLLTNLFLVRTVCRQFAKQTILNLGVLGSVCDPGVEFDNLLPDIFGLVFG